VFSSISSFSSCNPVFSLIPGEEEEEKKEYTGVTPVPLRRE